MDGLKERIQAGKEDVMAENMLKHTILFRLQSLRGSPAEFSDLLRVLQVAGADLDHMDYQGNTALMLTKNDSLGVALVGMGASTFYHRDRHRKRALSMAAVNECPATMDAIMRRDRPSREFVDRSFHSAAFQLSFARGDEGMSGLYKLAGYGADVNAMGTLARCVDRSADVISALLHLGADRFALTWDWERGCKNTSLHRVSECQDVEVFEALVEGLGAGDLDVRDDLGCTPLMTLLSEELASEDFIWTRFVWLMDRGASCLPFAKKGYRVSQTAWGKQSPFSDVIAGRVREENWLKRRGFVFVRQRGYEWVEDPLVLRVVSLKEFGLFRHVLEYF